MSAASSSRSALHAESSGPANSSATSSHRRQVRGAAGTNRAPGRPATVMTISSPSSTRRTSSDAFWRNSRRPTASTFHDDSTCATGTGMSAHSRCQVPPQPCRESRADRMEMAHSIEGRVPFLDHHVAEVATRVPVNMKVKGIREKHVLREAAKDVLIPRCMTARSIRLRRLRHATRTTRCSPSTEIRSRTLAASREGPDDQRIAVEGGLQRVASIVLMQELFSMA